MTDLTNLTQYVVDSIKHTEEYVRYNEVLEKIRQDDELYKRLNEMRQKNYMLQQANSEEAMESLDALTNEYEDVINLELVSDFLNAEAAYVYLVKEFSDKVVEGLDFK
ncbi:MAG: YlbF family regulator [Lachnospiraceae bacterium]|nr:YlbF family regulator [Lachnospiraceae bacterium]